MFKLVIDLEMAAKAKFSDELKHPYIQEIIQIGAVLLDEDNNTVKTFESLVKPTLSRITRKIEKLTNITEDMLVDAPNVEEAMTELLKILPKNEEVLLCTWSDSDTVAISREFEAKGIINEQIENLCNNYFDIQKEFSKKLNFEHILNLEKALNLVGIDFEGRAHGALADAINTAKIYISMNDDEEVQKHMEVIRDIMKPEPLTSSLGSMIDFSKFNLE